MKKNLWIIWLIFAFQVFLFPQNEDNQININNGEAQTQQTPSIENENIENWSNLSVTQMNDNSPAIERIEKIIAIWNLNVYKLFNIPENEYDTPLKKKVFEKSQRYVDLKVKLEKLKDRIKPIEFFFELTKNSDTSDIKSAYNLQTKKFELIISDTYGSSTQNDLIVNMISNYGFKLTLPLKKVTKNYRTYFMYNFDVDEATALQIENDGKVKIFFKIKQIETKRSEYSEKTLFITHSNRIEIIHKKNNSVLFKKTFIEISPENLKKAEELFKKYYSLHVDEINKRKILLKKISLLAPDTFSDFHAKGLLSLLENNFLNAVKYFTDCIEIEPSAGIYSSRSSAYEKLNQFDAAIADLTKAIELSEREHIFYKMILLKDRAKLYKKTGKHSLAQEDEQSIIKIRNKLKALAALRSIRPAYHIRAIRGRFQLNTPLCAKYMGSAYNEVAGTILLMNILFREMNFISNNTVMFGMVSYLYLVKNGILHIQMGGRNDDFVFIIKDHNMLIGKESGIVFTRVR